MPRYHPAPRVVAEESVDANVTTINKVKFSEDRFPPGASVKITYNWESKRPTKHSFKVFVLVYDAEGAVVDDLSHDPDVQTGSPGWVGKVSYQKKVVAQKSYKDGKYKVYAGLTRRDENNKFVNETLIPGPGVVADKRNRYLVGEFTIDHTAPMPPLDTERAPSLDLKDFELAFDEDFNELSVSRDDCTKARWMSHTPWWGDYGDARFCDANDGEKDFLEKDFPFTIVKEAKDERHNGTYKTTGGILRIEMRKNPEWKEKDGWKREWAAGLLANCDTKGNGFGLQYGYFECRMMLPHGPGVWPAFWLSSQYDRSLKGDQDPGKTGSIEIDVIEYYGMNPEGYQSALHVWSPGPHQGQGASIATKRDVCCDDFHNYGVMVMPDFITYYFDGIEVWKAPTPKEHNKPLMMLVNLAAGSGWPIDKMISPSFMYVDYVRAWKKKEVQ